jgi:hypothetical protein
MSLIWLDFRLATQPRASSSTAWLTTVFQVPP